MTLNAFKNWVLVLVSVALFASVVDRCNDNRQHAAQVTEYDNVIADLEADRLLILDSVDVLNEQLQIERDALPKRLNDYSKLPKKERIKWTTKIDTMAITTDTMAILSIHGIDSVNKLTIHYQSCMVQSGTKDNIISHLTNVVQADSVIIESQKKQAKAQKKAAKIKAIKAAVMSGLVGVVIGLVL